MHLSRKNVRPQGQKSFMIKKKKDIMEDTQAAKEEKPDKDKKTDAKNPMEDSEYIYRQTLGRILEALADILEVRKGRMSLVTSSDIIENSGIKVSEFDTVFGSPWAVIDDIYTEIRALFSDVHLMPDDTPPEMKLYTVFKRLQKNSPMLRVLRLTVDHKIWRDSLREFVEGLAQGWPPKGSGAWEYLYRNFCCQFASVLEKWEKLDFSDDKIGDCINLTIMWLGADSMIGETAAEML